MVLKREMKTIELRCIMKIKTMALLGLVLGSSSFPLWAAGPEYTNTFADKKLDQHFVKFTTVEIINDFKKAIVHYNLNRKSAGSFAENINSTYYRAQFEKGSKEKKELPEILMAEDHYSLSDGPNKIQFSIDLVLKNQFYLNGKLYSLDQDNKRYEPKLFSTYFHQIIDLLVSQSIAGDEFTASPESTRTLVAGIIALDSTFEKIGFTCVLGCKEKTSKINSEKLIKRISGYKDECEKNIDDQEQSINRYNRSKDIFDVITVGSSEFDKTYKLLSKMSEVQKKSNDKKIIAESFEQDMSQKTCYDQIRNTYKMWITNVRMLTDEREELDQKARSTCEAIEGLKSCLSNFHAQATTIYNSTSRQYKEQMRQEQTKVPAVNGIAR